MTRPRRSGAYQINQSPLYKLEARRKLATLLEMTTNELSTLAARTDNFDIFTLVQDDKPRVVESPKYVLRKLHSKLFDFLQRIETPSYLHSGVKGRSYISNAREHLEITHFSKLISQSFIHQ